jgi:hypothetical protein
MQYNYDTQTGIRKGHLDTQSINVKRPNAMCNTKIGIDTVAYKVTKARKGDEMSARACQETQKNAHALHY